MTAEVKVIPRGYNAHVVEVLEEILEKAKAGEAIELVMMVKNTDGTWSHKWTGTDSTFNIIGALEIMKYQQLRRAHS